MPFQMILNSNLIFPLLLENLHETNCRISIFLCTEFLTTYTKLWSFDEERIPAVYAYNLVFGG